MSRIRATVTFDFDPAEVMQDVSVFLRDHPETEANGDRLTRAAVAYQLQCAAFDEGGLHGFFNVDSVERVPGNHSETMPGRAAELESRIKAALARISGEWDQPDLAAWGPVSPDQTSDVLDILRGKRKTESEIENQESES